MSTDNQPTDNRSKPVYVDPLVHAMLDTLAERCHRTIGGQVTYLIERALIAEGIDPTTLEPLQLAATGQE